MYDCMLDEILQQVGITKGGSFQRIRLGRGAAGKATNIMLGVCAVFGVIAVALGGNVTALMILAAMLMVLALIVIWGVLDFARANPAQALLEGADLVKWREIDMAAKNIPALPPGPSGPDPQNPVVQIDLKANKDA
jgi:hypothetical protein